MGKSTISMAIFNCYVSSPEGKAAKAAKAAAPDGGLAPWPPKGVDLGVENRPQVIPSPTSKSNELYRTVAWNCIHLIHCINHDQS